MELHRAGNIKLAYRSTRHQHRTIAVEWQTGDWGIDMRLVLTNTTWTLSKRKRHAPKPPPLSEKEEP